VITPEEGVVVGRRYALARPLARGAMGSVWVARHCELDIDVTVKFMDPSLVASAEARARFEHEAKSAARLDSQHVVQVLDYGIEDDTPYIVMELLKGETLATRLGREGRLPLAAAARLTIQLGKALRTAHDAGLVHRDLKPGNVFVAIKDDDEVAKVLDFGIAKSTALLAEGSGTSAGTLLGSAHYMSPEQVRSSATVDARSDLWSLAIILYRALVGRLPFPGKDLGDVLVRVCTDPVPPPSSIDPTLPARLDGFFARALDRDPARRFQSARELSEAFCTIALDAPVSSSRYDGKSTIRMDMMSVPPPPPSSAPVPVAFTPRGTHIMSGPPAGIVWPPPPPAGDDAATIARPRELDPTLRASSQPAPPGQRAPADDDPPVLPVHRLSLGWVAIGALGAGAILVVAFWGASRVSAPTAASTAAEALVTPADAGQVGGHAQVPGPASAPLTAISGLPSATPSAPAVASAPSASASGSASAQKPPNPPAKLGDTPNPSEKPPPTSAAPTPGRRVVDGIIREPFAH
jgi:serine/threonine-protein kinase